jgi:hypothetical protein
MLYFSAGAYVLMDLGSVHTGGKLQQWDALVKATSDKLQALTAGPGYDRMDLERNKTYE